MKVSHGERSQILATIVRLQFLSSRRSSITSLEVRDHLRLPVATLGELADGFLFIEDVELDLTWRAQLDLAVGANEHAHDAMLLKHSHSESPESHDCSRCL